MTNRRQRSLILNFKMNFVLGSSTLTGLPTTKALGSHFCAADKHQKNFAAMHDDDGGADGGPSLLRRLPTPQPPRM